VTSVEANSTRHPTQGLAEAGPGVPRCSSAAALFRRCFRRLHRQVTRQNTYRHPLSLVPGTASWWHCAHRLFCANSRPNNPRLARIYRLLPSFSLATPRGTTACHCNHPRSRYFISLSSGYLGSLPRACPLERLCRLQLSDADKAGNHKRCSCCDSDNHYHLLIINTILLSTSHRLVTALSQVRWWHADFDSDHYN
jgi:hypothetical protein